MFELVTLILVLHVLFTIFRRDSDRRREVERLKAKVSQLTEVVARLQRTEVAQASEQLVELELNDIRSQLQECQITSADTLTKDAFEQLHFVEETISKSIVMAPELPTQAESTLD